MPTSVGLLQSGEREDVGAGDLADADVACRDLVVRPNPPCLADLAIAQRLAVALAKEVHDLIGAVRAAAPEDDHPRAPQMIEA